MLGLSCSTGFPLACDEGLLSSCGGGLLAAVAPLVLQSTVQALRLQYLRRGLSSLARPQRAQAQEYFVTSLVAPWHLDLPKSGTESGSLNCERIFTELPGKLQLCQSNKEVCIPTCAN